MGSRYALYNTRVARWWLKILKAKHDRKDVKLLGTKKSIYVKVNTPSVNQVWNPFFWTLVYQSVTSDPKIISRMENVKNIWD